jgi:hypothetical protein
LTRAVGIVADGKGVLEVALTDEAPKFAELFAADIGLDRLGHGRTALGVASEGKQIVQDLFGNIYGDSHGVI